MGFSLHITRHMFVKLLHNPPSPPLVPPPPTHSPTLQLSNSLLYKAPPTPHSTHPFSSRQSRSRQAWVIHWAILPLALPWPIYFMLRRCSLHYNQTACFANCSPEFLILAFIQTAGWRETSQIAQNQPAEGVLALYASIYLSSSVFVKVSSENLQCLTPHLHFETRCHRGLDKA